MRPIPETNVLGSGAVPFCSRERKKSRKKLKTWWKDGQGLAQRRAIVLKAVSGETEVRGEVDTRHDDVP
jgi:hypothetical protein